MNNPETTENNEHFDSKYALQVAFQTMKERCQQLQSRLTAVEKENVALRLECSKNSSNAIAISGVDKSDEQMLIKSLQGKVEELTKQKSQLTHHVFMVASENRQLWNRLTKLTQANKSLGNQLTNIMDTLKKHPPMDPSEIMSYSFKAGTNVSSDTGKMSTKDDGKKELSLEEISLKLINSIMLEKSELEQQYAEMVELQSSSTLNLQNVGFTYPDDVDTSSLEHMKQHEIRLSQTKETLLAQQEKLKKTLKNIKRMRKGTTGTSCLKNSPRKLCRTETQIRTNENPKENNATQTSLSVSHSTDEQVRDLPGLLDEHSKLVDSPGDNDLNICPLCGEIFEPSKPFEIFHEHVLTHFSN